MKKLITIFAVITVILSAGGMAFGTVSFESGSLTTVAHSKVDAAAVADWKTTAANIESGAVYNKVEFQPTEASIWTSGGVWSEGGMMAYMTTISGLQANDIIVVQENQQWRPDSGSAFESFYSYNSYIKVTSYTHNSTNTILNWLNYINDNGDGTFTFVKGSAVYEITGDGSQPDPASIVGVQYKIDRTLTIYRDATLLSPTTNSRGYITGSGYSGGTQIATYSSSPVFTIVPEPATIMMLGLGALSLIRMKRRGT